jgi:hypothetical protein
VTEPTTEPATEDRAAELGQQSLLPPTSTGDPDVDAVLATLNELGEQPVHEHVATFEGIHAALAESLADLDPDA